MTSNNEIAGGHYSNPLAAGAWVKDEKFSMFGFIPAENGNCTAITYEDGLTRTRPYTGCFAGHFYRFEVPIIAATFSVGVTAYF